MVIIGGMRRAVCLLALTASLLTVSGCAESPTAPSNFATYSQTDLIVGTGGDAVNGKVLNVHYTGWLTDGKKFDSAFDRGESSTFGVGGVVPGFSEALQLMKPGDRWLVFIPANLGYGASGRGPVPPNADLVFEIEMVSVR